MSIKATKTPGGHGGDYNTPGVSFKGVSYNVRAKIVKKRKSLLRAWKRNLKATLKAGRGMDIHLDMAMKELMDDLQDMIDVEDIEHDEK